MTIERELPLSHWTWGLGRAPWDALSFPAPRRPESVPICRSSPASGGRPSRRGSRGPSTPSRSAEWSTWPSTGLLRFSPVAPPHALSPTSTATRSGSAGRPRRCRRERLRLRRTRRWGRRKRALHCKLTWVHCAHNVEWPERSKSVPSIAEFSASATSAATGKMAEDVVCSPNAFELSHELHRQSTPVSLSYRTTSSKHRTPSMIRILGRKSDKRERKMWLWLQQVAANGDKDEIIQYKQR